MNRQAVEEIRYGNTEKALGLLKNALVLAKRIREEGLRSRLLSQVFNSFGNLFKKCENFEESLKFFCKSAQLQERIREEDQGYVALAHLGMSGVYSQLSRHGLAIKHGTLAINLMKSLINIQPKLVSSLVIAYYNVGNEYKHVGQLKKSEQMLRNGLSLSSERLGQAHDLTEKLQRTLAYFFTKKTEKKDFRNSAYYDRRLPVVTNKRSSSDNRDYYRNSDPKKRHLETAGQYYDSFSLAFRQDLPEIEKNDRKTKRKTAEEDSTKTGKSFSSSFNKRIDLLRHRETERNAAVIIQSWWRGVKSRERFAEMKMDYCLKAAEEKANQALSEFECLKKAALKLKRKNKTNK